MAIFFRKSIGDLLLAAKVISREQLEAALVEQNRSQKNLGQVLTAMGFISEEKLMETLEQQLGIPHVHLDNYYIDPEVATSIPAFLARRYQVIPIARHDHTVTLAMADPLNVIAIDDVSMITGAAVETVFSSEHAVSQAIDRVFGLKEPIEQAPKASSQKPGAADEDDQRLRPMVEETPSVQVVDSIIKQAVAGKASDIHVEPAEKGLRIRLRIDGALHDLAFHSQDTQPLIISRIKILAGMDITERRLPQDGRLNMRCGTKDVSLRVSTLPTIFGEKIVLRILEKERIILPLAKIGFNDYNYRHYRHFIRHSSGLILVTGPTGCGKTTTLYSTINHLNVPEKNIITVEDPVEYRIDGINQVQVNTRIGLSFASALRTILRQDPNIIMIGEIRDRETAEIATRAALTGHLVFSTLHTNDAPQAISRLVDMGVESFLLTSSLIGVVAQRLLRRICKHCQEQYQPPAEEIAFFQKLSGKQHMPVFNRGRGCQHCHQTGFKGMLAIHELVPLDAEIRRIILRGGSSGEIRERALEKGMITMLRDGLARVEEGVTSLSEVLRVAYTTF